MNVTFGSFGECMNLTLSCFGHGNCEAVDGAWRCVCIYYYDWTTLCKSLEKDPMFYWIIGLICSAVLLLLFLAEMILQVMDEDKEKRYNKGFLCKLVMFITCCFRIIDYSYWGYNLIHDLDPNPYANYFLTFYPYLFDTLCYFILNISWYSLVLNLSLSAEQSEAYIFGRNVFKVITVVYGVGTLVMCIFIGFLPDVFMILVTLWLSIPTILGVIHSFIQVYRLHRLLASLNNGGKKVQIAKYKNKLYALISLVGICFVAAGMIEVLWTGDRTRNLIIFGIIRIFECIYQVEVFILFKKYIERTLCRSEKMTASTQ